MASRRSESDPDPDDVPETEQDQPDQETADEWRRRQAEEGQRAEPDS